MLELCSRRPFEACFGMTMGRGNNGEIDDELKWCSKLKGHAFGEYSMAVVQANSVLEDQARVLCSPAATFVGVVDGHGGPWAARFVKTHLFSFLQEYASELGGVSIDAMRKAFRKTEGEYLKLVRSQWLIDPQIAMSGSCCLAGAIQNGTLYMANLGDSRAVLGQRVTGGRSPSTPEVRAERLTSDHNVGVEAVRQEVQALHPDDMHIVVHSRGFWRIKGIIQVSRAIGDIYLKSPEFNTLLQRFGSVVPLKRAVITAEPSISQRTLNSDDLFLIFASDGFWEHISDEAAVEIVYKSPRFGIAGQLARVATREAARKTGIKYEELQRIDKGLRRHFHDDITVIVVYLDDLHSTSKGATPKDQNVYESTNTPADVFSYSTHEGNGGLDSFS